MAALSGVSLRGIPGFEGYAIDAGGRVYSLRRGGEARPMAPYPGGRDGKAYVKLAGRTRLGNRVMRTVAVGELQLLAAGLARPGPGAAVGYLDGDPRNNSASNVVWAARRWTRPGPRARGKKLDATKVRLIRNLHAAGEGPKSLAAKFRVSALTVYRILQNKIWKHVR